MNRISRYLLPAALAAAALCLSSCTKGDPPHEADPVLNAPAAMQGDYFALNMFRALVAEREGNVTFSPASLESVLRLLREGAGGGSRMALDALPLGQQGVKSAMRVQEASALFVAEYMRLKTRPAQVHRVPFATKPELAQEEINDWCDRETHGLVPQIVSRQDITPNTRLVALNAVYLKETWLRPFDKAATREKGSFTLADGRELTVPLMFQCSELRCAEGEDWQAVALFYRRDGREGEPGCFIGILPRGAARDFARELTAEKYNSIRRALADAAPQRTSVILPKLEVDSGSFSLRPALVQQGLQQLFGAQADFSALTDEELFLSDVLQRCHVIVSEKETEAAAVTGVVMECKSAAPEPKRIHFTRPFVWAIGDLTTGAPPYFLGLCESPRQ